MRGLVGLISIVMAALAPQPALAYSCTVTPAKLQIALTKSL